MKHSFILAAALSVLTLHGCAGTGNSGGERLTLEAEDVIVDPSTGDVAPKVEAGISIPLRSGGDKE